MSIFKYLEESLISEKRKHDPEHYMDVDKAIEHYSNRPDAEDIYVHFSNDFTDDAGRLYNKVGINLKQN